MSDIEGLDFYIKKKKYNAINRPLYYVPRFLEDKKYRCGVCSHEFTPNWLEKRTPLVPVKLMKDDLWAMPIGGHTKCASCNSDVPVDLPKGEFGEEYYLFADEAYRDFGNQYLVNYSLVGVRKRHFLDLASVISSWKEEIYKRNGTRRLDVAHLTDLWSSNVRKRTLGAENLTKEDVVFLFEDLAGRLSKNNNIRLYSCSALLNKDKKSFRKQVQKFKELVTFNLFSVSLQESTKSGCIPQYIFEDDGKMGWLTDMFERMKLTLMFPFITEGKPVPNPKIIAKSKDEKLIAGIEAADALCFSAARSAHNQYKSQAYDLDMKSLGSVAYIQFDKNGNAFLNRQNCYPGINA